MISPQLHQHVDGFDEILRESDADFAGSGLKTANVIRVGRPAVIEGTALEQCILSPTSSSSDPRSSRRRRSPRRWRRNDPACIGEDAQRILS
ncbi:MAG: hypothetical protein BRD46_01580 [Bacteroidetes bacterium QS_8_68_15]|nr:MAG: hypothetical protein BRD46_01580 [Bacteroidetes bacterium QS_8_68_15]